MAYFYVTYLGVEQIVKALSTSVLSVPPFQVSRTSELLFKYTSLFDSLPYTVLEKNWLSLCISTPRSSHRRCSVKKVVLRNLEKFTGKHKCQSLLFNKLIKKETLAQTFSCEFCEISKNNFFTEHLRTTASIHPRMILLSLFQFHM